MPLYGADGVFLARKPEMPFARLTASFWLWRQFHGDEEGKGDYTRLPATFVCLFSRDSRPNVASLTRMALGEAPQALPGEMEEERRRKLGER